MQGLLVNTHSNRYSLRQSVTHSYIYNVFIYDEYSHYVRVANSYTQLDHIFYNRRVRHKTSIKLFNYHNNFWLMKCISYGNECYKLKLLVSRNSRYAQ